LKKREGGGPGKFSTPSVGGRKLTFRNLRQAKGRGEKGKRKFGGEGGGKLECLKGRVEKRVLGDGRKKGLVRGVEGGRLH